MRIGFVTCVELGRKVVQEVLSAGYQLDVLITLSDNLSRSKSGRVYLGDLSSEYNIPLVKVRHVNDAAQIVRDMGIDWLFIVGWSQIAGRDLLDSPTKGTLGMHPTLLPEGRGRASIPWAIIKGLDVTGVSLFKLDEGVDTGPILSQQVIGIDAQETASSLYEKAVAAHVELALNAWPKLLSDTVVAKVQDDERATIWPGRKPEDGALNEGMTVTKVDRLVRATTRPYPGAFLDLPDQQRLRIWSGHPGQPADGDLALHFRDGQYSATEYQIEDL